MEQITKAFCQVPRGQGLYTIACLKETSTKEGALDDLPSKDEKQPSPIRPTLELSEKSGQPWNCLNGKAGEMSERQGGKRQGDD